MKLLAVHASNFRTMKEFHFEFPQEAGLYYITGENRDQPELGSNGVGKSSLWECVNFAFEGLTSAGLRGGDVIRDGAQMCIVAVDTDRGRVQRNWSKGKKLQIFLDDNEVSQERLREHLGGLDRVQFLAAHCIPQTHSLFVDLAPNEQITMIQQLLNMERWVRYAASASDWAKNEQRALDECARALERALGELEGLDPTQLEAAAARWKDEVQRQIEQLERTLAEVPQDTPTDTMQKELEAKSNAITRARMSAQVHRTKMEAANLERAKLVGERSGIETQRTALHHRKQFFDKTPACPTCEQKITAKHKGACLKALADELAERNKLIADLDARINGLAQTKGEAQRMLEAAEQRHREQQLAHSNQGRALDQVGWQNQSNARQRLDLTRQLAATRSARNPIGDELEQVYARMQSLEERVQTVRGGYEAAEAALAHATLWSKGFKSIRSQLVSAALVQFELDITAVLDELGLHGWKVKPYIDPAVFEMVRATSGFRFEVTEPSGIARPLEAYSGGELQRVRLAVQLGIASLIALVNPHAWDFEVWDEPTTYLSEQGVQGLFRSLHERALRLDRPIWIIDHHQVHFAELSGVYKLVLEGGETQLEE